jgi:tetratricopeptide (TPR) repeat protein
MSETDPKEILRQARQLVKSEQYAEALEKYIWFHHHALEADRALAGVRLSYAIFEWVDLGGLYPPARRALESVRDTKTESLIQGTHDASVFHDVAAINGAFGQVERTSDLFKTIAGADHSFAEKCFPIALECLIHTKEFALARSFMPDPQKQIDQFAIPFKFARQTTPSVSPAMVQETLVRIYVKKVNLILRVFIGVGEEDASNQLRHYAVECVPEAQLQARIMEQLRSSPPSERSMDVRSNLTVERCLAIVARGADALQDGNFTSAEENFHTALTIAKSAPTEQGRNLVPLVLLKMSRLRERQNREDDARQLQQQAMAQLEQNPPTLPNAFFHFAMANVLMESGEYRRAIPFWEQAIQLDDVKEPIDQAHMLARVGECYNRSGLKDQAAIPLRAAVKIFRKHPEDPRLSAALITLGNALRKSTPAEAEACYREVADWHVARGQLLSATPAWGNMGILCSEQGRFDEALEYLEKVRKIREQSPRIPTPAIAITLNNIANCYRRMGKFEEAFTALSRAIDLLQNTGGLELASAYGTRGLIFLDQGRDADAVEWLRRAYEHHQTLPSPNLDTIADDLNREIAALRRLGRPDELKDAEARLASVHAAMKAVPRVNRDLSALDGPVQCAVFVELNVGLRERSLDGEREDVRLGRRLKEVLEGNNLGWYAGQLTIPESTTMILYGPDAEILFRAIEPTLRSEQIGAGARITIRQRDGQREVILPSRLT